ncbi:ATPase, partial [Microcoleus sp. HI-ES]|nr:ATPase [Microcoleus sp. HI-ES]
MLLGTSETVGEFSDFFAPFDKNHKIYSKKQLSKWLSIDLNASSYPLTTPNPAVLQTERLDEIEMEKEADRIVLNHYAPVGVVINTANEILQFRGQTNPYLKLAPGRASFSLLRMAKEGLRVELATAIQEASRH